MTDFCPGKVKQLFSCSQDVVCRRDTFERGTNENTNGLVRRTYPKKTDFNKVSTQDLDRLQEHLNNRPRKVLGYHTPKEIYHFEFAKLNENVVVDVGLEMGNKSFSDLFSFLMPNIDWKLPN